MLKILLIFYSAGSNVVRLFRLIKEKGKSMGKCQNLFKGKVA